MKSIILLEVSIVITLGGGWVVMRRVSGELIMFLTMTVMSKLPASCFQGEHIHAYARTHS